jgi:hypothetical protein
MDRANPSTNQFAFRQINREFCFLDTVAIDSLDAFGIFILVAPFETIWARVRVYHRSPLPRIVSEVLYHVAGENILQ